MSFTPDILLRPHVVVLIASDPSRSNATIPSSNVGAIGLATRLRTVAASYATPETRTHRSLSMISTQTVGLLVNALVAVGAETSLDEQIWPQGIKREYWIELGLDDTISPDGVPKTLGNYFNNSLPGPPIEACWGDTIVVHVTNKRTDNGTTVHWHGVRQLGSNEMDGVNGVTQCPIAPGDNYTYTFNATQYGHSWYHSHYALQYPDGAIGPLIIHGPTSDNWDIDLGPVMISDWVHQTSYQVFHDEMSGRAAASNNTLVNGLGTFNTSATQSTGSYFQTCFKPGKKHLMKLINGAIGADYRFSIDNHIITVIATDFVPIEPYNTTSLFIGIGQRYTVIVEALETKKNHWLRTIPAQTCSTFDNPFLANATAIVRYEGSDSCSPPPFILPTDDNAACTDESMTHKLSPIVPWQVDVHPLNNLTEDYFNADIQTTKGLAGYAHWMLKDQPLWLTFGNPTIVNLNEPDSDFSPNYAIVDANFDNIGYFYMIIDATQLANDPPNGLALNVTHPIHLHGSDFVILGQSFDAFNISTSIASFDYNNPPRRDVAMLPGGGYLAVAFKPDNPGVWLVHCHIAWHASSGLALQILVRRPEIVSTIGSLDQVVDGCRAWNQSAIAPIVSNPDVRVESGV